MSAAQEALPAGGWGRAVARLSDFCLVVAKACIAGMTLLVTVDVILRLVARAPVRGAYEVVGLLGALAVAGALPHIQRTRAFIVVETLTETLKGAARAWLQRAMLLVETIFFALLFVQFAAGTQAMRVSRQVTDILNLPVWLAYAAIAFCFACVTLVCLWQLLQPLDRRDARVA
ncbi:TRAP transporter small permease [Ramlibacter henchirensis]|uniref:TRAP transporter small permease protein n=1 Tax=Ramlibacter henchirensis TaxID=204072 RepID=A0A4Z0BP47_9BURK|nr:TRAP transporter small permease [Ramlibacter henchirensis]TFZ00591.1 TRAP transporter small permease [Ramlibacter henchirensis]